MSKYIFILFFFLISMMGFSQTENIYNRGYDGIDYIAKVNSDNYIVSSFNAKKEIKAEVAQKVFDFFKNNNPKDNESITVTVAEAVVTGKLNLVKSTNVTNLNFYYEKIVWKNGTIDVYQKK